MSEEKQKVKVLVSPKGKALYPFITLADTKFDSEGVYRVDLLLDPKKDTKHKKFLSELKAMIPNDGHAPYKPHIDIITGEKTDLYRVHFTSKYAPKQFDSKGTLIKDDKIMANNSIIKVAFVPNAWENIGGKDGLKLYLQAIQIFHFIEWHGADADYYGFEEESDGYTVEEPPFNDDSDIVDGSPLPEGAEDEADDDDMPF